MDRRNFIGAVTAFFVTAPMALAKKYRPKPAKLRVGNAYKYKDALLIIEIIGDGKIVYTGFRSDTKRTFYSYVPSIPRAWAYVGNIVDDYLK